MENKITEYQEIEINIDGIDYYVNFRVDETWYWVDYGIGYYEYFGAPGIHEDWQWELGDVEVFDVSIVEFDVYGNAITKSLESFDPAFAINISEKCVDFAKNNAEEPSNLGSYDKYSHIDPESYWADRNEYRYYNYYEF